MGFGFDIETPLLSIWDEIAGDEGADSGEGDSDAVVIDAGRVKTDDKREKKDGDCATEGIATGDGAVWDPT
jgi:hypothetical protein